MPGLERILLAACLALASVPACAAGWGVEDLMRELAAVESSQARFVERKYLRMLKAPLEQSGTLSYSRPGRLERRTLKPRPETLSVSGDTLVLESPARNERRVLKLRDYPVLWGFVESIRGTLGGDLPALERFYRVELEGARSQWRLDLVPRERAMGEVISLIRIAGGGARIHTIEVQEARGDRSVMKIEAQQP
ncbi:MAG TPA: LolA-related protein [Burkholderiales bacterium]|nr:LolA-related protein [Burkholderiales bacterium]